MIESIFSSSESSSHFLRFKDLLVNRELVDKSPRGGEVGVVSSLSKHVKRKLPKSYQALHLILR